MASPGWIERPLVIGVVIGLVLSALSAFTDHRAYLSTDTGGKVATLESMVIDDDWSMDLGYWAEAEDPDGSLYPFFATKHIGDQWVNVTSLPMILAARPLYRVGGYRLALLLPMLGTVLTALGAGAIHRRLGDRSGAAVSWIVGLAGPALVYGLDLWEHSIGLALMVWGTWFVVGLAENDRPGLSTALAAGLAFGAAATMRQEALIYGLVAGLVTLWTSRQTPVKAISRGAAMASGAIAMLAANAGLERVVLGDLERSERAGSALSASGGNRATRLYEFLISVAGPMASRQLAIVGISGLFLVGLTWLGASVAGKRDFRRPAVVVTMGYLVLAANLGAYGLNFVPGLLVVAPFAGLGILVRGRTEGVDILRAIALLSMPLVAYFQYSGGIGPQWGARYMLTSTVLLTIVGVDLAGRADSPIRRALLGVSILVSAAGVGWIVVRTHAVAEATNQIAEAEAPVTVFWDPFFAREAGPLMLDGRWLTTVTSQDRSEAVEVLKRLGVREFVYVAETVPDDSAFEGYRIQGTTEVPLFDENPLMMITYSD